MSSTDKSSSKRKYERTLKLNFGWIERLRKGINTQWRCEWNRQWMSERNLLWSRWRRDFNRKTRKREGIENQGKEPKESLWRRQRQPLRAGKTESLVLLFLESLADIFSLSLCFTRERIEKGRRMIGPTPTSPQAHSLHVNLDSNEVKKGLRSLCIKTKSFGCKEPVDDSCLLLWAKKRTSENLSKNTFYLRSVLNG